MTGIFIKVINKYVREELHIYIYIYIYTVDNQFFLHATRITYVYDQEI